MIFYNTHPAIIEQEVFDKVQEIRQQRHRRTATGKSSRHYIRAVVLEDLVWNHMKEVISYVTRYEAYFRTEMEQNSVCKVRKP